jgi:PHD/YefM family antitoxin component YafN of YafNO toxin-antitoxin module
MTTKAIASTEAQNNFGRILTDVILNNTRYVVKRRSVPQVIILSLADFEQLLASQSEQHKLINVIHDLMPIYELGEIVHEEI